MTLQSLGAALLAAGLMTCAAHAAPVTIDFDESGIALGDEITNQYASFGLSFSGANKVVRNESDVPAGDPNGVMRPGRPGTSTHPSSPSFLAGYGSTLDIDVLTGFTLNAMTLSYAASPSNFAISVFDQNGVESNAVPAALRGTEYAWVYDLVISLPSVSRIRFNSTRNANVDFFIENLRFNTASTSRTPEPAVLGLVALALAGAAFSRRRSRSAPG